MEFESSKEFIENSFIGIHMVSSEGIIVFANSCELEVLGYTENEYVGHHVSEFQIDKDILSDMMCRLERHEGFQTYPSVIQGKHSIKYMLYSSNVYEKNGKFVHTRCFGTEITKSVYDLMTQSHHD